MRVDITLGTVALGLLVGCVQPGGADAGTQPGQDGGTGGAGASEYVSGTRLHVRFVTGEDGSRTPFGGFHDSALGVDCVFSPVGDGGLRCLPLSGDLGGHQLEDFVSGTWGVE